MPRDPECVGLAQLGVFVPADGGIRLLDVLALRMAGVVQMNEMVDAAVLEG